VVVSGVTLQSSSNLRFRSMTIDGATLGYSGNSPSAEDVTFTDIEFTEGVCIHAGNDDTDRGIEISYSSFVNVGRSCGEGRLTIHGWVGAGGAEKTNVYNQGILIDRNLFQGPGPDLNNCSDGIQFTGDVHGVNVTNNEFKWIDQHPITHGTGAFDCDDEEGHIDPFQPYAGDYVTITGNFFNDNTTGLLNADCNATHTRVTNNVWRGNGEYGDQAQAAGGSADSVFSHNTVYGNFRTNGNSCNGYAGTVTNNVIVGTLTGNAPSGTVNYNMTTNATLRGANGINSGSPVFVGGSQLEGEPGTTWAGFDLDPSSPGYRAGSDNRSMGVNP
jgi:hypothetical protein